MCVCVGGVEGEGCIILRNHPISVSLEFSGLSSGVYHLACHHMLWVYQLSNMNNNLCRAQEIDVPFKTHLQFCYVFQHHVFNKDHVKGNCEGDKS